MPIKSFTVPAMAKVETRTILVFVARLVAVFLTVAAAIAMGTSNEESTFYGLSIHARYDYEPAFRYFVGANAVAAAYSFLVLFVPAKAKLWRLVVTLDLAITLLLMSSLSAAIAIGYIGKEGNSRAGWLPICDQFNKFCSQATLAIIFCLAAVLVYAAILLHSIHTAVKTPS